MAEFGSSEFNTSQFNDQTDGPTPPSSGLNLTASSFNGYLAGPGVLGGVP